MAFLEDLFKGNVLTGVAIGLGAILLAPAAGQVLRPAAKAVIKGGMLAYRGLAELGEMASDIVADSAELGQKQTSEAEASATPSTGPSSRAKR